MATIELVGLNFLMPVIVFVFVLLISYAFLKKTNIFGDTPFYWVISFILAGVFLSFNSLILYVTTVIPWFVLLILSVFMVLVVAGMCSKNLDWIMGSKLGFVFIGVLVFVLLAVGLRVYNPVFHPDLIITPGGEGSGILMQIKDFITDSRWAGSILLVVFGVGAGFWMGWK